MTRGLGPQAGCHPERSEGSLSHSSPKNKRAPLVRGSVPIRVFASYALKLFPQPQPPVALGFVTENPAPRKSST